MLSASRSQERGSGLSRTLGSPFLPYLNKQIGFSEMVPHAGRPSAGSKTQRLRDRVTLTSAELV